MHYGPDRRGDPTKPDTGERRRQQDIRERTEDFRLLRDRILLTVGAVGLCSITIAAVFIEIKNQAVVLAALTAFASLLGLPTALRLDERRRERNNGES